MTDMKINFKRLVLFDDLIKKLGIERNERGSEEKILEEIQKDVNAVNKNLQPYQRISKITILKQPLEMTTTQKVKRKNLSGQNKQV